jgi:PBSX family phage terminase large subunit
MKQWMFTPKTKRILANLVYGTAKINILEGAVRSGKTILAIIAFIMFIKHGPPGDLIIAGKTERTVKRNILLVIRRIVGKKNYSYNSSSGEATIYGRLVYVASAANEASADRIQGMSLVGALGDEWSLWPKSFTDMLMTRFSEAGARAFFTTNPEGPKHYIKTDYLDRAGVDPEIYAEHFLLEDNPALPPDYVAFMKRLWPAGSLFYQRFILGLWVMAEGVVYDMWNELLHRLGASKELSSLEPDYLALSIDYGTQNPFAGLLFKCWNHPRKHEPFKGLQALLERTYYYDGRSKQKQKTDSEYAKDLLDFLGTDIRFLKYIIVDPSASSFKAELKKVLKENKHFHVNVVDAKNDVLDGIRTMARMLVSGALKIGPDKSNEPFVTEVNVYSWDTKAANKGEDKPIKENDHALDAARYLCMTLFGKQQNDYQSLNNLYS